MTSMIAENEGVRHTAIRAPRIRSSGERIPSFFQVFTKPPQFAHFQRDTIPQAPRTAIAGVALNMNRAAVQAMKEAARIQIPNTSFVCLRSRRADQIQRMPIIKERTKVIGPN